MAGFFIATGTSLVLSLAAPNERGTTMAANRAISILLGTGLIPLLTGAVWDALGGTGSIRLALLFTTALLPLCTYCYIMIYRIVPRKELLRGALKDAPSPRSSARNIWPDSRRSGTSARRSNGGRGAVRRDHWAGNRARAPDAEGPTHARCSQAGRIIGDGDGIDTRLLIDDGHAGKQDHRTDDGAWQVGAAYGRNHCGADQETPAPNTRDKIRTG